MDETRDESNAAERVAALVEEFLERRRRGENPTPEEYAALHPELAGEIRGLLRTLRMVEEAKAEVDAPTGTASVVVNGIPLSRIGDYRIIREVGRGAMGVVYEAEQLPLGRHVAVKMMSGSSQDTGTHLARFLRESRAAARLHHTNIVPVFGVGEEKGLHYYVMQFIPGVGLDQILCELKGCVRLSGEFVPSSGGYNSSSQIAKSLICGEFNSTSFDGLGTKGGHRPRCDRDAAFGSENAWTSEKLQGGIATLDVPLKPRSQKLGLQYFRSVAHLGVQAAEALAYAHAHGTLHRDIKPSNLILDPTGTIWVTDFGLAKLYDDERMTRTRDGSVVGTLLYMAPERFRGVSDARCDICSLGLTLYELLTLRPAFDGSSHDEIIRQISQGRIPAVRRFRPDVPRDLETIIMKAVEPDPDRRYQSAGDLAEDLKNFILDREIGARRSSTAEKLARWCRRNPLVATLTSLVAVLLVAISLGSIYSVSRVRAEQEARIGELAEKMLTAPPVNFPFVFEELRSRENGAWKAPFLDRVGRLFEDPAVSPGLKQRAAVVLSLLGRAQTEFLVDSARIAPASEFGNLALALRQDGSKATASLRRMADGEPDLVVKARLAILLLNLADFSSAREMLAAREDPRARSIFIREFAAYGNKFCAPEAFAIRGEPAFISGLCACLGGIEPEGLVGEVRSEVEKTLIGLYRNATSGAVHSTARWAILKWKLPLPELEPSRRAPAGRGWFMNSEGITMIDSPPGFAILGETADLYAPPEPVYLPRPVFLSDCEVSAGLYRKFLADADYPSDLKPLNQPAGDVSGAGDPALPVRDVSLFDAILFANWLSWKEQRNPCYRPVGEGRWRCDFQADGYRLPTEAEWEHACRAGSRTAFISGDSFELLAPYAHVGRGQRAMAGGERMPNALGFFDMISNVWERCWDIYHDPYDDTRVPRRLAIDPIGPADSVSPRSKTTIRGGAVDLSILDYTSGRRLDLPASTRSPDTGFRVACSEAQASAEEICAALQGARTELKDAWRALRRWYCQQGRFQQGETAMARLLEANPRDTRLRIEYGVLLTGLCLWDQAEAAFRQAVAAVPEGGPSLFEGSWWVAGPYSDSLRAPEEPEGHGNPCGGVGSASLWRPALPWDGDLFRLDTFFDYQDFISGYALTNVYSLRDQEAVLLVGSDDQVRVWINGILVHEVAQDRMAIPDNDRIPVRLRAGWNRVLAKVVNKTGGHFLYLRWSTDPVRVARAHGEQGNWDRAVAILEAVRSIPGRDTPAFVQEHARALASALRWDEAAELAMQASSARDPSAPHWLQTGLWVIGPCALNHDPGPLLGGPPDPSQPVAAGGSMLHWRAVDAEREGAALDLKRLFNADRAAAYVLTYVNSRDTQEVALLASADDRARVWLNGEPALDYTERLYAGRISVGVVVRLRTGWNWILARVENDSNQFELGLRLSNDPSEMARVRHHYKEQDDRIAQAIKDVNGRPKEPSVYFRLANLLAERGDWRAAAFHFKNALSFGAPQSTGRLLIMALVANGDRNGAGVAGAQLLHNTSTSEGGTGDLPQALWTCLLSLDLDVALLPRLKELAGLALQRAHGDPFCSTVMGAVHRRAGEYSKAVEHFQGALDAGGEGYPAVFAGLLLAMTKLRIDEGKSVPEAAARLERELSEIAKIIEADAAPGSTAKRRPTWEDRLSLQLLHREAQSLLRGRGAGGRGGDAGVPE